MKLSAKIRGKTLPVVVEKDEDGFYVADCPLFMGCSTQGKTLDEVLENIREVIELCVEEKKNLDIVKSYSASNLTLHSITL